MKKVYPRHFWLTKQVWAAPPIETDLTPNRINRIFPRLLLIADHWSLFTSHWAMVTILALLSAYMKIQD